MASHEFVEKGWKARAQAACKQASKADTGSKQGAADTIEELEKITANSNLDKQKKYLDTEECLDFIQTLLISDVEVGITKLKTKLNTK